MQVSHIAASTQLRRTSLAFFELLPIGLIGLAYRSSDAEPGIREVSDCGCSSFQCADMTSLPIRLRLRSSAGRRERDVSIHLSSLCFSQEEHC